MENIRYKELTTDNAFDFVGVLHELHIDEFLEDGSIRAAFDQAKLLANKRLFGTFIITRLIEKLITALPTAREAIYDFLAGCTEIYDPDTNTVTEVTAGVLRTMKIGEFTRLLKDFAKQNDLADFFKEASELFRIEPIESSD